MVGHEVEGQGLAEIPLRAGEPAARYPFPVHRISSERFAHILYSSRENDSGLEASGYE